jgi:hypothetical protein
MSPLLAPVQHALLATKSDGPSGPTVIAALVVVVVAIATGFVLRSRRRRANWHRAPAVVTELVERSVGGGNHALFPVFTFVNAEGVEVSVQQKATWPRHQLGDRVDVLQDPNDPYRVVSTRK